MMMSAGLGLIVGNLLQYVPEPGTSKALALLIGLSFLVGGWVVLRFGPDSEGKKEK
jgi:uncharacterized membrane protein HdeD (DUF308 family)